MLGSVIFIIVLCVCFEEAGRAIGWHMEIGNFENYPNPFKAIKLFIQARNMR